MDRTERQIKEAFIRRCTADELRGWVWARFADRRPWFEGEVAAIQRRARELGITVRLSSDPESASAYGPGNGPAG